MENDDVRSDGTGEAGTEETGAGEAGTEDTGAESASDGLLDRLELIESQPLDQRARGFEQLHDDLLADLQRGDHQGSD